jgi:5'-3' exonuclease
MGIPSYYKKLCDSIPGLLSKVRKGKQPTHLWIDFNCMVYHCLRRPGARLYEGEETRLEWENHLIQEVCKYLKKIVSLVDPTEQVFVGVDGVVPMAKMRQQRLRRFKSHWTAAEEVRIGKSEAGKPRWDTNAITPGTAFMERLGNALRVCKSNSDTLQWIVSTAEDSGEGEHKAMRGIRSCHAHMLKSHVVYGLDADLILLSLLQPIDELWLFREAVECGEVQYVDNEEEYRYFSIHKLKEVLTKGQDNEYLLDYCMAMSFLGNDFLPHGMTLKLKDGGYPLFQQLLRDVRSKVGPLIVKGQWNPIALLECFKWLADREVDLVQRHCSQKIGQRHQPARGTSALEEAIDEWNKTPLRICEEMALVSSIRKGEDGKTVAPLKDTWSAIYSERWLGTTQTDRICHEYLKGLDWILHYYTGNLPDPEWCFPWFLPPLWKDLYTYTKALIETSAGFPKTVLGIDILVQPQEQLTLVLPLQSWWLIRNKGLRAIPRLAPQFWPSSFSLFTAGHKQIWECEAEIPLFMPERLRQLMSNQKQ